MQEERKRGKPGRKTQRTLLERFLGKVPHADVYGSDGIRHSGYFDYVNMCIGINGVVENPQEFAEEHKEEIIRFALSKLSKDTAFTRYGYSAEDLILKRMKVRGNVDILLVFRKPDNENKTSI